MEPVLLAISLAVPTLHLAECIRLTCLSEMGPFLPVPLEAAAVIRPDKPALAHQFNY